MSTYDDIVGGSAFKRKRPSVIYAYVDDDDNNASAATNDADYDDSHKKIAKTSTKKSTSSSTVKTKKAALSMEGVNHDSNGNGDADAENNITIATITSGTAIDNGKCSAAARNATDANNSDDDNGNDNKVDDNDDDDDDDGDHDNSILEAGHVISVYVENFMCHKKMTIQFGNHCTFITGQNGSGKSAVAAAIQLCLGASSNTTGRGRKTSNLVREGSPGPAILRLKIRNTGDDSYRHDVYGDYILIERKISKSGGGGYCTYNGAAGPTSKPIETKKEEIDRMLDAFNVQVDNPTVVLTQEESKIFINGNDRDKYTFFLKASSLTRIMDGITLLDTTITETEVSLKKNENIIRDKRTALDVLKNEFEELLKLDSYDGEIQRNLAKLEWVKVSYIEDVTHTLMDKIDDKKKEIEKAKHELSSLPEINATSQVLATIEENLNELKQHSLHIDEEIQAKTTEYAAAVKEDSKVKQQINKANDYIKHHNERISYLKATILEQHKKANDAAQGDEKQLLLERDSIQVKINEATQQEEDCIQAKKRSLSVINELKTKEDNDSQLIRTLEDGLRKLVGNRDSFSGKSSDKSHLFGPRIPAIVKAIAINKDFTSTVVGPVGMYVSMKEQYNQYDYAVERALAMSSGTFIVKNIHDKDILMRILQANNASDLTVQMQPGPTVRYQIERKTHDGVTVLDAITVSHDEVYNYLVEEGKHLTVLCVDDNDSSKYKAKNSRGYVEFTCGIRSVILQDGTLIYYFGNGNQANEAAHGSVRHLFSTDKTKAIAQINSQIDEKTNELNALKASSSISQIQHEIGNLKKEMNAADKGIAGSINTVKWLTKEKQKISDKLSDIAEASAAVDTSGLENEEKELVESIRTVTIQLDDFKGSLVGIGNRISSRQTEKKDAERRKRDIRCEMDKLEKQTEDIVTHMHDMQKNIDRTKAKLAKQEGLLQTLVAEYDKEFAKCERMRTTAHDKTQNLITDWDGLPIPLNGNDTETSITATIKALQLQLEKEKKKAGLDKNRTLPIVTARYKKTCDDYEQSIAEYRKSKATVQQLVKDKDDRIHKWEKTVKHNEKTVKHRFDSYLNHKGQSGTVEFNHGCKELRLICQTDNKDSSTQMTEVSQLSGGERSFTALALLLSLGHVIDCPFRILDEYDVFLDDVTRTKTLQLLVDHACRPEQNGRQFIIITPHNLKGVVTNAKVKINRLAPPERQSAHGLQQTTLGFTRR